MTIMYPMDENDLVSSLIEDPVGAIQFFLEMEGSEDRLAEGMREELEEDEKARVLAVLHTLAAKIKGEA